MMQNVEALSLIPVGIVVTLVLGGIGYGEVRNKANAAHARLDAHDKKTGERDQHVDAKLEEIRDMVGDVRLLLEQRFHSHTPHSEKPS